MSIHSWEHFFKPEVRTSGRSLFTKGKVAVSQPSDTEITIFIRATPGFKVSFKTKSVESNAFTVDCNCPAAKKDLFCKHIWAGLLATEEKNSDFFESKTEIEKKPASTKMTEPTKPSIKSEAFTARQEAYKEKQAHYRKEQYQKQKERQKAYKESKRTVPKAPELPADVENALSFFSENGLDLRDCLNSQAIGAAKKKLARVFHPDKGGNHNEIVELNKWADVLLDYTARSI